MPVLLGTSGWQYADWRGRFYPAGLAQARWLEHHAAHFATVEVNNAFYRLPERRVFQQWAERTPADYVITVKASRYLTHVRRLSEPAEPVARLMDRVSGLGTRLGAVLLQLPPTLAVEPERLRATLQAFPAGVRLAVEPRHPSWWVEPVAELLRERGAALVWADRGFLPVTPLWRTAGWGYLRLHGGGEGAWGYPPDVLAAWAERLCSAYEDGQTVYVYTNNDPGGAAVRDAAELARLLRERGRTVGRALP